MTQTNQDTPAGRIQPSQFDIVLPPDARAEMLKPRRPTILRRGLYQPPDRSDILQLAGAFALAAIILAAVLAHYSSKEPLK